MSLGRKMDGTGDHQVEQDKSSSERQITNVFTHMWNLDLIISDCKGGDGFGGEPGRGRRRKGQGDWDEYDQITIYIRK
jgi:hypothetical protein